MNTNKDLGQPDMILAYQLCSTSKELIVADPDDDAQHPSIRVYSVPDHSLLGRASSINSILKKYSDLRPGSNTIKHCIILNYLFWGYSYDIIADADDFRARYQNLPEQKYDVSTVAAPKFEDHKAVFFVKQGIKKPVEVTVSYETVQPDDGSDSYEAVRAVSYADLPLIENEKRQMAQLALATQLHPLSKINSATKATSVVHDGLNTTGEKPTSEQPCD